MKSSMQGTGDVISKTFMMSLVKLIGESVFGQTFSASFLHTLVS